VLSKWAHYQKNYGYKNTKASAKAAAPEISRELLKEFPAKDDLGLRLNDVQGVERLITPLFDMPKLPSASVIIGIIAAIAILPGMLGRYAKARH
jgi:hypothetical protein